MNRLQALFRKFRNKNYREAFVSARVAAAVGAQISALRQKRGWNQQQLAESAGMKQPRIALLEKGDYDAFSFTTLKRLASVFGVAVRIDFLSFTEFLRWSESFNSESVLAPESFEDSAKAQVFKEVTSSLDWGSSNDLSAANAIAFLSSVINRVWGTKPQHEAGGDSILESLMCKVSGQTLTETEIPFVTTGYVAPKPVISQPAPGTKKIAYWDEYRQEKSGTQALSIPNGSSQLASSGAPSNMEMLLTPRVGATANG